MHVILRVGEALTVGFEGTALDASEPIVTVANVAVNDDPRVGAPSGCDREVGEMLANSPGVVVFVDAPEHRGVVYHAPAEELDGDGFTKVPQ